MTWLEQPHQSLTQGAILDGVDWGMGEDNPLSIELSNACDFENDKAEYLMVAALLPASEILCNSREISGYAQGKRNGLSSRQKKAIKDALVKYIHNTQVCRYFFFDPNPVVDADLMLVDFQLIKSVSIDGQYEYIGQMKPVFTMQMMSRFVGYTGRVPVDRPDDDKVNEYIQTLTENHYEI